MRICRRFQAQIARSISAFLSFTYLDTMLTGGLGRSDLIILAARPVWVKPRLRRRYCHQRCQEAGCARGCVQSRDDKDQLVSRILSSEAAIDSHAFH